MVYHEFSVILRVGVVVAPSRVVVHDPAVPRQRAVDVETDRVAARDGDRLRELQLDELVERRLERGVEDFRPRARVVHFRDLAASTSSESRIVSVMPVVPAVVFVFVFVFFFFFLPRLAVRVVRRRRRVVVARRREVPAVRVRRRVHGHGAELSSDPERVNLDVLKRQRRARADVEEDPVERVVLAVLRVARERLELHALRELALRGRRERDRDGTRGEVSFGREGPLSRLRLETTTNAARDARDDARIRAGSSGFERIRADSHPNERADGLGDVFRDDDVAHGDVRRRGARRRRERRHLGEIITVRE